MRSLRGKLPRLPWKVHWKLFLLAIPLALVVLLFFEHDRVDEGRLPPTGLAKRVTKMTVKEKIEAVLAVGSGGGRYASSALKIASGKDGGDLNLFPDADIATPGSPFADRAVGEDPELVTRLTATAIRDCEREGIACAPGRFPGLGGASQDTDAGPATVGTPAAELARRDLLPFRAAIAAGAPAIVVSHAFYAAYDPVTPASLSPAVIGGLLRGQLGFRGVVITDDLGAGAITAAGGVQAAAPRALAAGADLVLIGQPSAGRKARRGIVTALKSGALPRARLDEAVARVLVLKRTLRPKPPPGDQRHRPAKRRAS
jgi:beta-N-acetylhexosaminidase